MGFILTYIFSPKHSYRRFEACININKNKNRNRNRDRDRDRDRYRDGETPTDRVSLLLPRSYRKHVHLTVHCRGCFCGDRLCEACFHIILSHSDHLLPSRNEYHHWPRYQFCNGLQNQISAPLGPEEWLEMEND